MTALGAVLAISAAALCATSTARAASFDCAGARTPHEHLICNSPALNEADAGMGLAFKAAVAAFPVKGAVLAVQQVFLTGYRHCDRPDDSNCLDEVRQQTAKLRSMIGAAVYASTKKGTAFGPEDALFWVTPGTAQAKLHYFGSYMPDMVRPDAFPNGVICDDEVTLERTAAGFNGRENGDEIDVTDDSIVSKLSCGGRTGIFGITPRVR